MAVLKNLFGKDLQLEKLPAELQPLVHEMRQERLAFESAVKKAEQLGAAIAPAREQLTKLEQRIAELGATTAQIGKVRQDATALEDAQRAAETHLGEVRSQAESVRRAVETIATELAEVMKVKAELPAIAEQTRSLGALRADTVAIEGRLRELHGTVSGLADRATQLETAASRAEKFVRRAEALEQVAEQLQPLAKDLPVTKRELASLNVLAEYVSRKVSTLESQRDLVDRASQHAERLAELASQVDRHIQEQRENMQFLGRLEQNVDEIKKLHQAALDRAGEIEKRYRALDAQESSLSGEFAAHRDALQQAVDRFKFERDGLEALSKRITELRDAVAGVEKRLPSLEQTRTALDSTSSEVSHLTGSVQKLSKQASDLQATQVMAEAAETRVRELAADVRELTTRMETLSPAKLSRELDERAQQMEALRVRVGGLEQKQLDWKALEEQTERSLEVARSRRDAVDALQGDLQRLFAVADAPAAQVRTVVVLQQQIDQRRDLLEPVLRKLSDLDRQTGLLEERQKQFAEAETRLARLDALLIDLQTTSQAVAGQKEFLERVLETAGNLALETLQAEAAINTLREAGEDAKARRSRGGVTGVP